MKISAHTAAAPRFGNVYLLFEKSAGRDENQHPTFPKSDAFVRFLKDAVHRQGDVWVGESWWKDTEDGSRPRFAVTTGRHTKEPSGHHGPKNFGDVRNQFERKLGQQHAVVHLNDYGDKQAFSFNPDNTPDNTYTIVQLSDDGPEKLFLA